MLVENKGNYLCITLYIYLSFVKFIESAGISIAFYFGKGVGVRWAATWRSVFTV